MNQILQNDQSGTSNGSLWSGWTFLNNRENEAKDLTIVKDQKGMLHAFMIGMDDIVWQCDQYEIENGSPWTEWKQLSDANRAKDLTVLSNKDGRLHAFIIGIDGQLWHNEQLTIDSAAPWNTQWTTWNWLTSAPKNLIVVSNKDGRLHAFIIAADNQVLHSEQQTIDPIVPWNTHWTSWGSLNTSSKSLNIIANKDGRLHAFSIGMDDQIWHNEMKTINLATDWTGWNVLSSFGDKAKSVTVVAHKDGRLHAFRIGTDDQLWHNEQQTIDPTSPWETHWTGWNVLSNPGNKAKSLTVIVHNDGRLHAFMIGLDDQLYHNEQQEIDTAAPWNTHWSDWRTFSSPGDKARSVTVVSNADGRLHAFMIGMQNQVSHNDQSGIAVNAPWSGWYNLSKPYDTAQHITIFPNKDGRLHAFMIATDLPFRLINLSYKIFVDPVTSLPPKADMLINLRNTLQKMNERCAILDTNFRFRLLEEPVFIGGKYSGDIVNAWYNRNDIKEKGGELGTVIASNKDIFAWRDNAVNIYMTGLGWGGIGGDFCAIAVDYDTLWSGQMHEIGHVFNLSHTHVDGIADTLIDNPNWTVDDMTLNNFKKSYYELTAFEKKLTDETYQNIMSYHTTANQTNAIFTKGQLAIWEIAMYTNRANMLF